MLAIIINIVFDKIENIENEIIYTREWFSNLEVSDIHKNLRVKQVTCFIITKDKKLLLVSKDGSKWSVTAGHYEAEKDSSYIDTAVREVFEESGLDISSYIDSIIRLGYYVVKEIEKESGKVVDLYLQIRTFLPLNTDSKGVILKPIEGDLVKYAKFSNFEDSRKLIKWLKDSEEWKAIKAIRNEYDSTLRLGFRR